MHVEIEKEKPQVKGRTAETGVGDDTEIPQGEFNEKESYDMFKEAIEQFRNSGSPTKHKINKKGKTVAFGSNEGKASEESMKKVRFLEPVTEEMLPKEIKGMLYEGTWEPDTAAMPETFEESSATNASVLISERKSCWNCYKIFSAELVYRAFDKEFCGNPCAKGYYSSRAITCACGKEFLKNEGIMENGVWVCSQKCQTEKLTGEGLGKAADQGKDEGRTEETKDEQEVRDYQDSGEDEDFIRIDPETGNPIS